MRLVERWNVDSAAAPQDEMPQAAIQAVLHHAVDGVLQARDREFGSSLSFRGPPRLSGRTGAIARTGAAAAKQTDSEHRQTARAAKARAVLRSFIRVMQHMRIKKAPFFSIVTSANKAHASSAPMAVRYSPV